MLQQQYNSKREINKCVIKIFRNAGYFTHRSIFNDDVVIFDFIESRFEADKSPNIQKVFNTCVKIHYFLYIYLHSRSSYTFSKVSAVQVKSKRFYYLYEHPVTTNFITYLHR